MNPPALARPRPELKLLFSIDTPHYTMVRMNQTLKAKSPILRFWKVFGLEPKNGKKTLSVIMLSWGRTHVRKVRIFAVVKGLL